MVGSGKLKKYGSVLLVIILLSGLWTVLETEGAEANSQTAFYVHPDGSGDTCTLLDPCSLDDIRQVLRNHNNEMTQDLIVYLRGGIYHLEETYTLTALDSGKNGNRIVYRAYPEEHPVLSGGMAITNWQVEGDYWKSNVGSSIVSRHFQVNGIPAVRARGGELAGAIKTANGYSTTDLELQHWENVDDLELVFEHQWIQSRCRVEQIQGGEITVQQPCFDLINRTHPMLKLTTPSWIENARELLDEQGEWYHDRTSGWLYYMPRQGETIHNSEAVLAKLETLVSGVGSLDEPVENLVFDGINFSDTTWLEIEDSYGFAANQANFRVRTANSEGEKPREAVKFTAAKNIEVINSAFVNLGSVGLGFSYGSQYNRVEGNVFTSLANSAIQIGDIQPHDYRPSDVRMIVKDNLIANNYIHDVARDYTGGVGIWAGYTQGLIVRNNELHNLPYTPISIGWGWGTKDTVYNPAGGNLILDNRIDDYMNVLFDGGGIYTLSSQPGSKIEGNVVGGIGSLYGAIYLDQRTQGFEIVRNVLYDNASGKHVHTNRTLDNRIVYNMWDYSAVVDHKEPNEVLWNSVLPAGALPASILNKAGLQAEYRHLRPRPVLDDLTPPDTPDRPWLNIKAYDTLNISWKASEDRVGVTGYEIYRDDQLVGATAETVFTLEGLEAGTTYEVYIRARDAAGNVSEPSEPLLAKTYAYPSNLLYGQTLKALNLTGEAPAIMKSGHEAYLSVDGDRTTSSSAVAEGWLLQGEWFNEADISVIAIDFKVVPEQLGISTSRDGRTWQTQLVSEDAKIGRNAIMLHAQPATYVRVEAIEGEMEIAEVEVLSNEQVLLVHPGEKVNWLSIVPDSEYSLAGSQTAVWVQPGVMQIIDTGDEMVYSVTGSTYLGTAKVRSDHFEHIEIWKAPRQLYTGQTHQLQIAGFNAEGVAIPLDYDKVVFASDSESTLSVSTNGELTANLPGTASIEAYLDGYGFEKTMTVSIPIVQKAFEKIALIGNKSLRPQQVSAYDVAAFYNSGEKIDLTGHTIQYSSSVPEVAEILPDGTVVAGNQYGKTTLSAEIEIENTRRIATLVVYVYPTDWNSEVVGQTAQGEAIYDEESGWKLSSQGRNIYGVEDEFTFVYQTVDRSHYPAGVAVTATVYGFSEDVHASTMAGLMIRSNTDKGARHVNYRIHADQGAEKRFTPLVYRLNDNGASQHTITEPLGIPTTIRLAIVDERIQAHYKDEQGRWVLADQLEGIEMPETLLIGLAHASHHAALFSEAIYRDVSISAVDFPLDPLSLHTSSNLLQVGSTHELAAHGVIAGEVVKYSSDRPDILQVDEHGVITGISTGFATVTAAVYQDGRLRDFGGTDTIGIAVYEYAEELRLVNAALGKQTYALTPDGKSTLPTFANREPDKGVDGRTTTAAHATTRYDWMYKVDLGNAYMVEEMSVQFLSNAFATSYELLGSMDGVNWETLYSSDQGEGTVKLTFVLENPRMMKYAAVRALKPDGAGQIGGQMAVAEFEVMARTLHVPQPGEEPQVYAKADRTVVEIGRVFALGVSGLLPGEQARFTSTDAQIADVTVNGTVYALAPGYTEIQVQAFRNGQPRMFNGTYTLPVLVYEDVNGLLTTNLAYLAETVAVNPDTGEELETWQPISYAVDGKLHTAVPAKGKYDWKLIVDLGQVYTVTEAAVTFQAALYATEYTVLGSVDGESWITLGHHTSGAGGIKMLTALTEPQAYRYMAVRSILPNRGGQPGGQMSIAEFEVQGYLYVLD